MISGGCSREWFGLATVAAEILKVTSEQVVNETAAVTLECVVRANPIDVIGLITWYRVDDPEVEVLGAKTEVVASMATSRLFIAHASSRNAGLYRCVAHNGLGVRVNATANVVVQRTYFTCDKAGGCTNYHNGPTENRISRLFVVLTSDVSV